jgi:hypothetical protein
MGAILDCGGPSDIGAACPIKGQAIVLTGGDVFEERCRKMRKRSEINA